MKQITAALLLAAAALMLPPGGHADPGQDSHQHSASRAQSPDDDAALMEFLGGIGSEDDAWIDYLARNDPTKVAAAPKRARPAASRPADPPSGPASSASGSQQK